MNIRRDVRNVCLWHLADFDAGSEYVQGTVAFPWTSAPAYLVRDVLVVIARAER